MSYTINTIFGEEEMSIEDTKVCSICGERKHMHEFQLRSGMRLLLTTLVVAVTLLLCIPVGM